MRRRLIESSVGVGVTVGRVLHASADHFGDRVRGQRAVGLCGCFKTAGPDGGHPRSARGRATVVRGLSKHLSESFIRPKTVAKRLES